MEQTTTIRNFADKMMLVLLDGESPLDIHLPVWMVKRLLNREDYPRTPAGVLGASQDEDENLNLLEEFEHCKGYPFSWGFITESFSTAEEIDADNDMASWEVCPVELLHAFDDAAFFEDVMVSMYDAHPLAQSVVPCDEAFGTFSTMCFTASGTENIKATRKYLATTFVPKVLPDIFAAVYHLLKTTEGKPEQRDSARSAWLSHLNPEAI